MDHQKALFSAVSYRTIYTRLVAIVLVSVPSPFMHELPLPLLGPLHLLERPRLKFWQSS